MSFENPQPIPKENELPLNIKDSKPISHQGLESVVWQTKAQTAEEEKLIALKKVKRDDFSNGEEMAASKKFYDFLKNSPTFSKFVPDTLYFKAKMTSKDKPAEFRLQKFIKGKRIDEIKDEDLYNDPELLKELEEFTSASIQIFQEAKEKNQYVPDFYGNKILANFLFNPRYSSNIIISEKPDEKGQRIFFVDSAPQIQQKEGMGKKFQENIGSKLQLAQLERWRKK